MGLAGYAWAAGLGAGSAGAWVALWLRGELALWGFMVRLIRRRMAPLAGVASGVALGAWQVLVGSWFGCCLAWISLTQLHPIRHRAWGTYVSGRC